MVDSNPLGYTCKMKSQNDPELLPQEEIYIKVIKVTLLDSG